MLITFSWHVSKYIYIVYIEQPLKITNLDSGSLKDQISRLIHVINVISMPIKGGIRFDLLLCDV